MTPAGAKTGDQNQSPTGLQVGQGVKAVATVKEFSIGSLQATGRSLDMAIGGDGFFRVQLPDGDFAYTRDGSFKVTSEGEMVNNNGYRVEPGIVVPADVDRIFVAPDGAISVVRPGDTAQVEIGRMEVTGFINPGGLEAIGKNLYMQSPASGDPIAGTPGQQGLGEVISGHRETSNVKVVEEMVDLIAAQRAYEASSRLVRAADEMLRSAGQMK